MVEAGNKGGELKVTIKETKLNRDTANFGAMDPYVILILGKTQQKTRVHKEGGEKPRWDQEFTLNSTNPIDILELKIMDNNVISDDDVGRCQIKLSQLMMAGGITEWFVLLWDNKKAGEILLQSVWTGHKSTYQQANAQ